MNSNPLSQFFRQPAIYAKLPSRGMFYPPGALEMPENGELPVLPMTAVDEITYRTPDALFNGTAVMQVIQSCFPNIKNAWGIPAMDIDTLLIAIRIASYGHDLELDTVCPNCNHSEELTVDLRQVLEQISAGNYEHGIKNGDLEIFFRPLTYRDINENNLSQFEDQKMLQAIADADDDSQERREQIGAIIKKITAVTIKALAKSIAAIRTPETTVIEQEYIVEWLTNCDRKLYSEVKDFVINNKSVSEIKPLSIKCSECEHEYQQVWTLDMTNFFGGAS